MIENNERGLREVWAGEGLRPGTTYILISSEIVNNIWLFKNDVLYLYCK